MEIIFRPLVNWPDQKTKRPKPARFRVRYRETLELLEKELKYLKARNIVFEIDLPENQIKLNGLPYANARPFYQGIIIAFESKFGPLKYFTDVFNWWEDNLRAIALGLEALRKVDRYGISKRGEQYTGWKQLPASIDGFSDVFKAAAYLSRHGGEDVRDILQDESARGRAYKKAAQKLHPDKGGTNGAFDLLVKANRLLLKA